MDWKLGGIALCLLFTGCADKNKAATDAVAASLKDPASAQFRNVISLEENGTTLSCGEVNAKNSLGGYVGFTDYMYWQGTLRFPGESDRDQAAVRNCCRAVYTAIDHGKPVAADPAVKGWCSVITHPFTLK